MLQKMQSRFYVLLFVFGTVICCFAQNFEGTNLSSTKPFYSEMPYVFEGSQNYFISIKTDTEILRILVPEPLKPLPGGEMTIVFAKHNIVSPAKIQYNEAFFVIPVSYDSLYGGYLPVLYLDRIETITPAREIWGYNKVGAEFEFIEEDNKTTIIVTQMDSILMKASFTLGEPFTPPEKSSGGSVFNLKYIPSVKENSPPDVKQITVSELKDNKTEQMRLGKASIEFFSSRYNPLKKIPIIEIKNAGHKLYSFSMVNGDVLYDYLK